MAPLRVLFLVMIIVTVVTVTSGGDAGGRTRGASKFNVIKNQIKKGKSALGSKLKSITGNVAKSSHAQKAKDWGQSAHSKFKGVSEKHPGVKEAGQKFWAKVTGAKGSASKKTRSIGSKSTQVVDTVKKELKNIQKLIRNAKFAAGIHSKLSDATKSFSGVTGKLSGVTKSFTKARGLEGGSKFKSAVQQGSQKMSTFKEASSAKINKLKSKSNAKLQTIKNSGSVKKLQDKIPDSAIQKLKNMPGAGKLKSLAQDSGTATALKNKFSSVKDKFGLTP